MKKHILLVEYDTPTIELIQDILSSPVFVVDLADEGEKAKELVKKKKFDLVITAAMLPKFHGFNLSQFIGTISPKTKIIIISGIYKGIEYKHQAITQYKADEFIEKPLKPDILKNTILNLLDITEKDLKSGSKSPTTKVPLTDTAKIPAVTRTQEDKNQYTSSELFGDIIEEVEKIPAYEINVEAPGKGASGKKEIEAETPMPQAPQPQVRPKSQPDNKIESELASLKLEKKEIPDSKKFKKIEDDISKKLEDTLSGLGIRPKAPAAKPATEPVKAEAVREQKKETPVARPPKQRADELGDYDILGLIARGGMAEIYKAKRKGVKGFEKVIAIKKILAGYGEDDKYIEMFVDEAKIAAELSHPNIVQIYDLGKKDDYYFIAMEYVQGKDLRLILNKLSGLDRWIPEELSVYLGINVLEALGYAHAAKDNQGQNLEIVHRDISPPNILISLNGDIKITDFGVSKASIKIHQTISGALKGKLLYMSPEQAKGDKDIDYRSDLYSVGVLLFELITQKKLFMDSSEMGVLKKVQNGKIIAPSELNKDINPELERIILKSLSKEREERYQSASEMIDDLEAYLKNHFDHMPTSLHVAHFLHDLFKKEIEKEFTRVDLKPVPYEIKRKPVEKKPPETTEQPVKKEEEPESEEEELLLPENGIIEEKKPESIPQESHRESPEEEEKFTPTIEIDFEKPRPIKEYQKSEPRPPSTTPEADSEAEKRIYRPSFIEFDSLERKNEKKRRKFLFFSILLIFMAVVAAGYYFIFDHPARETSQPITKTSDSVYTPEVKRPAAAIETESTGQLLESGLQAPVNLTESHGQPLPEDSNRPESAARQNADDFKNQKSDLTVFSKAEEKKLPAEEKSKTGKESRPEPSRKDAPKKPESSPVENRNLQVGKPDPAIQEEEKQEKEENLPHSAPRIEKNEPTEQPRPQATPAVQIIKPGQIVAEMHLDSKPVAISTPLPRVSKRIRKAIVEDQHLLVSILIDHNGNIERVKLLKKSALNEINSLIISSLAEWKYKPALKNNFRVKTWKQIPVTINKDKE